MATMLPQPDGRKNLAFFADRHGLEEDRMLLFEKQSVPLCAASNGWN
jgi:hypothetical protein